MDLKVYFLEQSFQLKLYYFMFVFVYCWKSKTPPNILTKPTKYPVAFFLNRKRVILIFNGNSEMQTFQTTQTKRTIPRVCKQKTSINNKPQQTVRQNICTKLGRPSETVTQVFRLNDYIHPSIQLFGNTSSVLYSVNCGLIYLYVLFQY